MKTKNVLKVLTSSMLAAGTLGLPLFLNAAPGNVSTQPLFTQNAVDPNIIVGIDDSSSMDFETLFFTNDGALYWIDADDTFSALGDGVTTNGDKKYVYLFPNGGGSASEFFNGKRVNSTSNHYAIPPFIQYAYTRSPDYNKAYFDPTVTYSPWTSYSDQTFGNIDETNAPADPFHDRDNDFFNLTDTTLRMNGTGETFTVQDDMIIPKDTVIYAAGSWTAVGADTDAGSEREVAVEYNPAVYYTVVNTGTYQVKDGGGTTVNGDCSTPDPAHYTFFERRPSDFKALASGTHVALAPDGACLVKNTISAGSSEMQNFANWFSYYRKRHLATRNGLTAAFDDITGVRVGIFTINDRGSNIVMRDFDANKDTVFNQIYEEEVAGGTPNRNALDYAGQQYKRTDGSAPITDECQKNFTIFFTDGFSTLSGPTVGNVDDGAVTINGTAASGVAPYEDSYSDTLADIAMKYYTENLVPGMPTGQVPVDDQCDVSPVDPKLDCNTNLHMVTYTVGLGARGTIFNNPAVSPFYDEVADAYTTNPTWPDVNSARNPTQIDDLYHAAINGRGEMFNADTPAELAEELEEALKSITEQTGSASAVAFNTSVLSTGSVVYQARFNTDKWKGELLAFNLNASNGDVSLTANWDAGQLLPAHGSRKIITYNPDLADGGGTDTGIGVVFNQGGGSATDLSDSPLSSTARADLGTSLPTGLTALDRLDYLRGDRSNEGADGFRTRDENSVLGDIVHSAPVFVGIPNQGWPDGDAVVPNGFPVAPNNYSAFAGTSRTAAVYVGANDGMLHAFNAETGVELMAYVPHELYSSASGSGLHYLSQNSYQHAYYVDATPSISDVYTPGRTGTGETSSIAWRTVLVGGLRGGGKGVFALDITNPANFAETDGAAASTALWEFTDSDDADLGLTFSRPTIVPTHAVDGSGNARWAAIFGNGYNNGGTCSASLFIVFIDGGLDGDWTDSGDYFKIDTGVGDADDCNGLSNARVVDADGDSLADAVYAGDLHGNLWVFDICNADNQGDCQGSGWDVAYDDGANPTPAAAPLFTAKDSSDRRQPITATPTVISHPTQNGDQPNVLVLFGTGQYIVDADKSTSAADSNNNTFYGVWDQGTGGLTRANLFQQTFESGFGAGADTRVTTIGEPDYTGNPNPTHYGWYLDLPDTSAADNSSSGAPERVVTNSVVIGEIVFFNTLVPTVDGCDVGGYGYLMSVLSRSGGRPDRSIFDTNNDGSVNDSDLVTVGDADVAATGKKLDEGILSEPSFLSDNRYESTSKGKIIKDKTDPTGDLDTGRFSWQEIREE